MALTDADAAEPDWLEQAMLDFRRALAQADAAVQTLNEAHARLRALAGGEPAAPISAPPSTEPPTTIDRRYTPGPLPPVWRHVSKLAEALKCGDDTAWRIAHDAHAQWPYGGRARKVDVSKFRDVLPDLR